MVEASNVSTGSVGVNANGPGGYNHNAGPMSLNNGRPLGNGGVVTNEGIVSNGGVTRTVGFTQEDVPLFRRLGNGILRNGISRTGIGNGGIPNGGNGVNGPSTNGGVGLNNKKSEGGIMNNGVVLGRASQSYRAPGPANGDVTFRATRVPGNDQGNGYNGGQSDIIVSDLGPNDRFGGVGDIHARTSIVNYSLNEKRNGGIPDVGRVSGNIGGTFINGGGVNNSDVNSRINPGVSRYDSNPLINNNNSNPNTYYNSGLNYNNTGMADPNSVPPHSLLRNSSNNSSTSSSHPSTNNSRTNMSNNSSSSGMGRQHPLTRDGSGSDYPHQYANSASHLSGNHTQPGIPGILRHPGSTRVPHSQSAGNHSSDFDPSRGNPGDHGINGGIPNSGVGVQDREKVVRIDPCGYDVQNGVAPRRDLHHTASGMVPGSRQVFGRGSANNLQHGQSDPRQNFPAHTHVPPKQVVTGAETGDRRSNPNRTESQAVRGGPSEEIQRVDGPLSPDEELRKAAAHGELGKIQTLLGKPPGNAAGAALVNTVDEAGVTALLRAACEGRAAAIKLLLRHGANADHQDSQHGNTALHEASWKGYSESCTALVRARADLSLRNRGGFAPLHLACQHGHNQSCRVLLLAGGDPNIKNNYGDTPLHTAARYGHAGVTRILLSAKADVLQTNKNGDSCLHIAAAMGRRKLTRILLEAGAVQTGRNKQNETPRDIARRKEFPQILEILENPPPIVTPEERLKREKEASKKDVKDGGVKAKKRDTSKENKSDKGEKKREKTNDSGTSSKDSSTRMKEKKKLKSDHKDRRRGCRGVHWSPYGCHNYPPALNVPSVDVDALPKDALKAGEQYFIDLAGNIKKGPVSVGTTCYCAPFFKKVEHKLETDKVALMDHMDAHHHKLDRRIHSLERKTHTHIHSIRETMEQKISEEKEGCILRTAEASHSRKASLNAHAQSLQQWVEERLAAHDPALPPTLRRTLTRRGSGRRRDPVTGLFPLTRSRSEEALTEITAELNESSYKGLRVMDHPTSMYNLHQPVEDEEDGTTILYDSPKPTPPSDLTVQSDSRTNQTSADERGAKPEDQMNCHEAQNSLQEPQGSLDLMQDSSDSEGEDEEQMPTESTFYTRYTIEGSSDLQQGVGKLTLNHPYYANTGAIPKNSSSSLPPSADSGGQQSTQGKEVVQVDVHAPINGTDPTLQQQRWTSYNRYDPRNNRHYLYDVQEVEPHYGDVAPTTDSEGRVRDSGCSDGSSSQAEIMDHIESQKPGNEYPSNGDTEPHTSSSAQGTYNNSMYSQRQLYTHQQQQSSNSSTPQNISRSSSKEFSEPHQQIQQQQHLHVQQKQQQQHILQQQQQPVQYPHHQGQQHYGTEADNPQYFSQGTETEAATYLDMDRYRIQQAVRRLYDGYLHDSRPDPSGSGGGSSSSSGASGSSGCSVGGRSRTNTALLESSLEHDSHNDSGYSTRLCTASQGPSPALSAASGAPDGSGSESRSGHSTSSPNNTVIAFPQHPIPPKAPLEAPSNSYSHRQESTNDVYNHRQNGGAPNYAKQDGGAPNYGKQDGDVGYDVRAGPVGGSAATSGGGGGDVRGGGAAYHRETYGVQNLSAGSRLPYSRQENYGDPTHPDYSQYNQQNQQNQFNPQQQYHNNNISHSSSSVSLNHHNYYANTSFPNSYYSQQQPSKRGPEHPPQYPHPPSVGGLRRGYPVSGSHLDSVGLPAAPTGPPTGPSSAGNSRAQLLDIITVGESSLV